MSDEKETMDPMDEIRQAAGELPEQKEKQEEESKEAEPAKPAPAEPKVEPVEVKEEEEEKKEEEPEKPAEPEEDVPLIFALRTTANREDQVMDFVTSNIQNKTLEVYSVIRPHGMRGYIFVEAATKQDAEQAAHGIPDARGVLPKEIDYSEMEHMIEPVKRELTIKKNDIVEIISGPFKRETAKITRIDEQKDEVVVELVEAAVPIPITLKIDAVKVIRRDTEE